MLSDYWSLEGTADARCPQFNIPWTWNDYRPVLGENAWAKLTSTLQVAYLYYGSVEQIPKDFVSIKVALDFLPSVEKMLIPELGAVYYAPKNTLKTATYDFGWDVSTENNISLLAGLKALRYLFLAKGIHLGQVELINVLIENILIYIRNTYDPAVGYFRQGGRYDSVTKQFEWAPASISFAVDCQTWTIAVVGPELIDDWFGAGSSEAIWKKTKELGGYNYDAVTGWVEGLGFSNNNEAVFFW